jgi:DNA-binding GntR family transcriptional regulator
MSSHPGRSGYELLRDAITSGALQPSQRLVEAELSQTFGLSRAAVRTALVRLEQDGLVSHERHRGAKVRLVTEREAVEILEARAALESLAVRGAALNATKADVAELRGLLAEMKTLLKAGDLLRVSDVNARLHRRLLEISRNQTAIRLTQTLNSQLVRFQFRTILAPGRAPQSLAEHSAVVDAVAAHDADAAEQAMRTHLRHVVDTVRASAEEVPAAASR